MTLCASVSGKEKNHISVLCSPYIVPRTRQNPSATELDFNTKIVQMFYVCLHILCFFRTKEMNP